MDISQVSATLQDKISGLDENSYIRFMDSDGTSSYIIKDRNGYRISQAPPGSSKGSDQIKVRVLSYQEFLRYLLNGEASWRTTSNISLWHGTSVSSRTESHSTWSGGDNVTRNFTAFKELVSDNSGINSRPSLFQTSGTITIIIQKVHANAGASNSFNFASSSYLSKSAVADNRGLTVTSSRQHYGSSSITVNQYNYISFRPVFQYVDNSNSQNAYA